MFYVYILHSLKDHKLYTGFTNDIKRRVIEHNGGKAESTKNRRPLRLIYYEAYLEKPNAKNREIFLKSGSEKRYLKKQLTVYFKKNGLV
jgi:putative endonuclease